ncbi:MAG: hypothetical protein ABI443_00730 [Chthoniobacterales bacterium]
MSQFLFILMAILIGGAVIAIAITSYLAEQRRAEELIKISIDLGLNYHPGTNSDIIDELEFLNILQNGDNRYAKNIFGGIYRDQEILFFDFHYETYTTDNKGNRSTHHYWHHIALLRFPAFFPELTIGPENILTRLGKAFGYPSIDFESHEFSKTFLVQSEDKKFAYDICNARAMEYLLSHRDFHIEIERDRYALIFDGRTDPQSVVQKLDYLIELRALIPDYLFTAAS